MYGSNRPQEVEEESIGVVVERFLADTELLLSPPIMDTRGEASSFMEIFNSAEI